MIFALGARFGTLDSGLRRRLWFGLGPTLHLGRRLSGLNELGDAGLDRLVSGQLGLGVKLEITSGPVKGVDHGVIAGLPVGLGVKEMAEKKVQRGRLTVSIADGKGTCGALTLSSLQKRSKGHFGQ
jgi:hypothetical protein